jgi:hypothetical protein
MTVTAIYAAQSDTNTKLKVVTDDAGVHLLDGPANTPNSEIVDDFNNGEFDFLNEFPAELMQSGPEEVAAFDAAYPNAEKVVG